MAPMATLKWLLTGAAVFSAWVEAYETTIYFNQPATDWFNTLPIGSGRLGATLYGATDADTLILNEDSFVSGRFRNRVNPNANSTFPRVRALMDAGKLTQAGDTWLGGMSGVPTSERRYEPAGYLNVSTGHASSKVSNYIRALDVSTGLANVSYTYGGVQWYRQAVASAPDNVIAFNYWSNGGTYNMTITLDRGSSAVAATGSDGGLYLRSTGADDSSYTTSQYAYVTIVGGSLSSSGNKINVIGANNVSIVWDAETTFYYPAGASTYEQVLYGRIHNALSKGFEAIKSSSIADLRALYTAASFTVNTSPNTTSANAPTDARLAALRQVGDFSQDPELLTLGYNFGRYMMISSSRPGTLPANLQGVWNDRYNPAFDSKFTIDINLEMNYWHADINGLGSLISPVWDLLGRMQTRGSGVASQMYNLTGWVCHHNTDIWGDCAPVDNGTMWTIWPMGGAWVLHTAIEHYRFTLDKSFASNIALPLLKSSIAFYNSFSVLKNGSYVTYPSNSPENSYVIPSFDTNPGSQTGIDLSPQSDRALMYLLYTGFLELSSAVGSTDGVAQAQSYLSKLKSPDISPSTGMLLEWSQDFQETEPGHRHFSPLIGLHPGNQYSPLTNTSISAAASKLLAHRISNGGGGEGWSRAWSSHLYSRLFDGDNALKALQTLLASQVYNNLWSRTSGVFQVDANFGLVSAVNEMFLQSHANNQVVHIGPAIPSGRVGTGKFSGWRARGGFVVDAAWENGSVTAATVTSNNGTVLALRVQGGRGFKVNGQTYGGPFQTTAGGRYQITF